MLKFGSSFEWAFRRSLFSLLLLLVYLLVGTLLLSLFAQLEQSKRIVEACKNQREVQKGRRLDFERNELLNTLWAESLAARSESDWSLVANTKLDSYERLLLATSRGGSGNLCANRNAVLQQWDFAGTFRSAVLLLTTAGGGPLTEQPTEQLGPATKMFAMLFSVLGIPLALVYLEHSVKAISALVEANFSSNPNWGLLLVTASGLLVGALAVDIALVEDDEEEQSFLDSLYIVALAFFTVSGRQLHQLPLWLLLPLQLLLVSLSGCLLSALIAFLHRWMGPHEFAFANGLFGKIEKAVSDARLDRQRLSDGEPEMNGQSGGYWRGDVPQLRFGIGGGDGGDNVLDDEEGLDEPSTTALLALQRKQSISTIEEEEGELNSQG